MDRDQLELFSKLFFMNLSKNLNLNLNIDFDFNLFSGQQSPGSGGSSGNQLEPPTPPRTPIISVNVHSTPKSGEKHYNNNNDDAKENYEENSMRKSTSTPLKLLPNVTLTPTSKLMKREMENDSDQEDFQQRHDDSNYSDEESSSRLGGRQSVSESGRLNGGDDSDHESDMYTDASSFDSSKLSIKNVEGLMDKSSQMVSTFNGFF
jgi:hypothetical protein